MSAIPIGTTITTAHDPRTDDAATMIIVEMTAATATATTGTMTMTITTMIGTIGMIGETPEMIDATATAIPATTGGTTTTAAAIARETPMHLGKTHHQTGRGIHYHSYHLQKERKLVTRLT